MLDRGQVLMAFTAHHQHLMLSFIALRGSVICSLTQKQPVSGKFQCSLLGARNLAIAAPDDPGVIERHPEAKRLR
jgi:hypothetical protein